MELIPETEVLNACTVLFGEEVSIGREFLFYLQPSGAKAAYRRRAKEVHPDRLTNAPDETRRRGAERFRKLAEAHELVHAFFRQRDSGIWKKSPAANRGAARKADAKPQPHPRPSEAAHRFYQGGVPAIHLAIGRYCYYRGVIPYAVLIEALCWQRRQRPAIGEIAQSWGWLSAEAVNRIFTVRGSSPTLFGEKAVRLGLLAPKQVNALLHYQRFRQQRLGRYFVERGYVTAEEMDRLARELAFHNVRVGVSEKVAAAR